MPRRPDGFPVRVAAIAGALVIGLALTLWFVSGLGRPAGQPEILEPEPLATDAEVPVAAPGAEPATDESGLPMTETVTLHLFVVDTEARRLVPRYRRIEAPMTLPAQAQLALERLVRVRDAGTLAPLPPGTLVREVWVSPGGIAYVDFDRGFPALLSGGSLAEIHAVYGVVATLTSSFPNIRSVQLLVNGQPVDTLTGHMDLKLPMKPLADWVY